MYLGQYLEYDDDYQIMSGTIIIEKISDSGKVRPVPKDFYYGSQEMKEEIDVNIAEDVDVDVDVEAVVELADELSELELKPLPKETLDAIAKIRKEHASEKKLAKKLVEDKRKTLEAERKRTEILLQRLLELEAKLREEQ